jgi:TRAP-type transport system small permease protein
MVNEFLGRVAKFMTMIVISIMMLLTVADVFLRYCFSMPITGVTEITEYLLVCSLLGMVPCAVDDKHIKVNIVTQLLPPKMKAAFEAGGFLVGMAFFAILAWQGFVSGLEALSIGAKSSGLSVPTFPFYVLLSLSFALLFIVLMLQLPATIRQVFK